MKLLTAVSQSVPPDFFFESFDFILSRLSGESAVVTPNYYSFLVTRAFLFPVSNFDFRIFEFSPPYIFKVSLHS